MFEINFTSICMVKCVPFYVGLLFTSVYVLINVMWLYLHESFLGICITLYIYCLLH